MRKLLVIFTGFLFFYVNAEARDISIPDRYYTKVKVSDAWNTHGVNGKAVYLDVLQIGENLAITWTTAYKSNHADYIYYFHQEFMGTAYATPKRAKHIPMQELVSLLSKECRKSLEFVRTVITTGYDDGYVTLAKRNEFNYLYDQVCNDPSYKTADVK